MIGKAIIILCVVLPIGANVFVSCDGDGPTGTSGIESVGAGLSVGLGA